MRRFERIIDYSLLVVSGSYALLALVAFVRAILEVVR